MKRQLILYLNFGFDKGFVQTEAVLTGTDHGQVAIAVQVLDSVDLIRGCQRFDRALLS
jgi:hypothetical protein